METTLTLRPTGLIAFLSCPFKWRCQQEQRPRLVSAALAIGTAFHRGAEVLVAALRARRQPTEVLAEAEATLEESLALEQTLGDPDPDDDKFDTAKDTAIGLIRAAARTIPTEWQPALVEQTAGVPITDDLTIQGTTDLVLTDGTIVDFKTRARKSSTSEIRRDLQFTAYALIRNHVDGKIDQPRNIAIIEVTKTKIPQAIIQPTTRNAADFATYRDIATQVAQAIRAGISYPVLSMWCTSCAYRADCPIFAGARAHS